MEDQQHDSAFLIVKTFESLYASYPNRTPEGTTLYSVPQEGIEPSAVTKRYRGLDREPLSGESLEQMAFGLREDPTWFPIHERAATLAMAHLSEKGRAKSKFIRFLKDTCDVYLTLGEPTDWEIVWASLSDGGIDPPAQAELLGYEPSYFPDGFFSSVCDCMCFPRWHGCDAEGTLFADFHARLNRHGLFDSPRDAQEYLRYYLSFDWTEHYEYSLIKVYALSDVVYEHLRTPLRYAVIDAEGRAESFRDTLDGMTWDVSLNGLPSAHQIRGIFALRQVTGMKMGLAEAKAIVDTLPRTLVVVYVGEVEFLKQKLLDAGFELEVAAHI